MTPESAMRLALAQARRARGRVFPNPAVGAVVFRGDRVLGRGSTRPPGGPHAEVVALENAVRRVGERGVRGASLAVTLEPCAHHGRTGPCADLVIERGIRRVLVGCRDPHPEVSGRGLRRLRRAGVEVQIGVLADECRRQHRGFLSVIERRRPFVTLKLAGTLDGRIATADGESRWITGPRAREEVHRMRASTAALAVGSGTALADDPELTARRGDRVIHRPVRVLVDSGLRVPVDARAYRGEVGKTWVLCSSKVSVSRRRRVEGTGARVLTVPARGGHLQLGRALSRLAKEGLTEVLVEGGGQLAAALLRRGLVDEVHWFLAPLLIGGDGRSALASLGVERLSQSLRLGDLQVRRLGDDVHVWGSVAASAVRPRRAHV